MIRLFFLLLSGVILQNVNAQVSYGVQLTPGFSYRKSLPLSDTRIDDLIELDLFEKGEFGYALGGRVEFGAFSKVSFQTGVNFQNVGYRTQREEFLISIEGTEEVGEREQVFNFQNLEIPLVLNFYQEMTATGRIYFKMGATILYHLKKETTEFNYIAGELTEEVTSSLNRGVDANFGVIAGMGYEQLLGDNLQLFIEPVFHYFLRSNHENDKFARQPYFLGVSVGLKI
ncbi:MAG: outer membrane beta-barrel protein [Saprospiraceae bacterium]